MILTTALIRRAVTCHALGIAPTDYGLFMQHVGRRVGAMLDRTPTDTERLRDAAAEASRIGARAQASSSST